MAGSPKKRAAREAAKRAKELQDVGTAPTEPGDSESAHSAEGSKDLTAAAIPTVPAPLQGEVLPPEGAEPTRTALKRAMRKRAQDHADTAIAVLVDAMKGADKKEARGAANDVLAWAFGKPTSDVEDTLAAGLMVVIQRFGENA